MLTLQANAVANVPFAVLDQAGVPFTAAPGTVCASSPEGMVSAVVSADGAHITVTPLVAVGQGSVTFPNASGDFEFQIVAPGTVRNATFTVGAAKFSPK